jgi:hypothetical protein
MNFLLWLATLRALLVMKLSSDVRVPIVLSSLNKLGTSVSKFVVGQIALTSADPLKGVVAAQVAEWLPGALATFAAGIATDYRAGRLLYLAPNAALFCVALKMATVEASQLSGLFAVYSALAAFSAIPITSLFRERLRNPIRDGAARDMSDGLVQLIGPVLAGFLLFPLLGQKAIFVDCLSFVTILLILLSCFQSGSFNRGSQQALSFRGLRAAVLELLQYTSETGAIWLLVFISATWGLRDTLGLLWLKASLHINHGDLHSLLIGDVNQAVAAYYFAASAGQIFGAWSIREVTSRREDPNWRSVSMTLAGIGSVILAVCCLMPCIAPMRTEHLVFLRFLDGIGSTIAWSSLTTVIVLGTPPERNGMAQATLKVVSGVLLSLVKLSLFLPFTKESPLAVCAVGMFAVSVWTIKLNVKNQG